MRILGHFKTKNTNNFNNNDGFKTYFRNVIVILQI